MQRKECLYTSLVYYKNTEEFYMPRKGSKHGSEGRAIEVILRRQQSIQCVSVNF